MTFHNIGSRYINLERVDIVTDDKVVVYVWFSGDKEPLVLEGEERLKFLEIVQGVENGRQSNRKSRRP